MRVRYIAILLFFACIGLISHATILPAADRHELNARVRPQVIRDIMWLWNTHDMDTPGEHTLATYAQADANQKMSMLQVSNVMMCGNGLPADDKQAIELTESVVGAKRLVWEISTDDGVHQPPFAYIKTAGRIRRLYDKYPKIEAVLLDDMTSLSVDAGFKPVHIRAIRDQLPGKYRDVKIWGVVYTMNMRQAGIDEIIKSLDVVNLWIWHARDIVDLDSHVAYIEWLTPEKPIVLGLYLFDYGVGRRIPRDLLEKQCHTALKLAHAGRIEGIVFLTITNDAEALQWTSDWIQQVGNQKIGLTQ